MKAKTALLITSAQNDLLDPNGKAWAFTQGTVEKNRIPEKLEALAGAARSAGIPVIHSPVALDHQALSGARPLSAIQGVILENQLLDAGSFGAEFIERSKPAAGDIVLPARQGFSAFWAQSIKEHLDKLEVETLVIAGMLAEGCVEAHARDAVENGYRPVVVSDAIGSTNPDLLEASLKTLALHTSCMPDTATMLVKWA